MDINNSNEVELNEEQKPFDMDIDRGEYRGASFYATHSLTNKNGKYVNFYISNNSNVDVVMSINNKNHRTIKAGGQGNISLEVSYFTSKYEFKASPTPNGGTIDIDFGIAQRDNI